MILLDLDTYIISQIILPFGLVNTYDQLEDRHTHEASNSWFFFLIKKQVQSYHEKSQKASKCGKNITDTLVCLLLCHFFVVPDFDVFCDKLLNKRTKTWNLFVKYLTTYWRCFSSYLCMACHYTSCSA